MTGILDRAELSPYKMFEELHDLVVCSSHDQMHPLAKKFGETHGADESCHDAPQHLRKFPV